MTVSDAARALEVSDSTVYALCASGRLGHYRIGSPSGRIRIAPAQLAAFLASCEVAGGGAGPEPDAPERPGVPPARARRGRVPPGGDFVTMPEMPGRDPTPRAAAASPPPRPPRGPAGS